MKKSLIALFITASLFGCSDDNDVATTPEVTPPSTTPPTTPSPVQGVFVDSAVIGIGYRTETLEGVTDENGNYDYLEGETVTFFIGDLVFPATTATGVVTPLSIAGTEDITNNQVVNMARLLQTLDQDGDPSNGITITQTAIDSATVVDFSLPVDEFAQSDAVIAIIENGGQDTAVTELITEDEALSHFSDTIVDQGIQVGIVGTWSNTETDNELLTLVFFSDGTYAHFEVESDNPDEVSGMEWGDYTRNSDGIVTTSQVYDENGDTGLTDFTGEQGSPSLMASVTDDGLLFEVDEDANGTVDDSVSFTKQANNGLVGTWLVTAVDDELFNEDDLLMFIFNADGSYIHAEVDDDGSGMEWGTYTLTESGMLTVATTFDSNGDQGLSGFGAEAEGTINFDADGNTLIVTVDEDGDGVTDTQLSFRRQ